MKIEIEDLKRVQIKQNDTVFWQPEAVYPRDMLEAIKRQWELSFPDNKLVILPQGKVFVAGKD